MEMCPICTQGVIDTDAERATRACESCQSKLGLIPMPPARSRGPCVRCGGRKFLRAIPREHAGKMNAQVVAPMFLTHAPQGYRGAMSRSAKELDPEKGHGLLEVYACYGCGAVAWYCLDVEAIPVHPHLMTEVVEERDP
jgi:hypothetical protein